jgi:hypothetical protein
MEACGILVLTVLRMLYDIMSQCCDIHHDFINGALCMILCVYDVMILIYEIMVLASLII